MGKVIGELHELEYGTNRSIRQEQNVPFDYQSGMVSAPSMGKTRSDKAKFKAPPKSAPDWAVRLGWALERTDYDRKALAGVLGVVPKTIDSWTDGRTEPAYANLIKLCEISNISIDWLLTAKGPPPA